MLFHLPILLPYDNILTWFERKLPYERKNQICTGNMPSLGSATGVMIVKVAWCIHCTTRRFDVNINGVVGNRLFALTSYSKKSMPFVLSTTRVTNSRFFKRQNTVWRRRQTPDGVVFTTRETLDYDQVTVIKNDQTEVRYKAGKLYLSLLRACDHMDESEDVAWQIKNTVEEKLIVRLKENLSIRTLDLAELSIETLKQFNTSAYVKYASHHPSIVSARKLAASIR